MVLQLTMRRGLLNCVLKLNYLVLITFYFIRVVLLFSKFADVNETMQSHHRLLSACLTSFQMLTLVYDGSTARQDGLKQNLEEART